MGAEIEAFDISLDGACPAKRPGDQKMESGLLNCCNRSDPPVQKTYGVFRVYGCGSRCGLIVILMGMAIQLLLPIDPPGQRTHGLLHLYRRGGGCNRMATLLSEVCLFES